MGIQFSNPEAFLFLLPFSLVFIKRFYNPRPAFSVGKGLDHFYSWSVFAKLEDCFLVGAVLFLLMALARPKILSFNSSESPGISILFCLDISGSMKAIDWQNAESIDNTIITPGEVLSPSLPNRFELAKKAIMNFIQARPNDAIGLIVFAKKPILLSPLSTHHHFLLRQLQVIQPGWIDDSTTSIGLAIELGIQHLFRSGDPHVPRILILVTDGKDSGHTQPTPLEAAQQAKQHGLIIHSIGVGSKQGYVPLPGHSGNWIKVEEFDPETLKQISELTNGIFFSAYHPEHFQQVMNQLDQLEKKRIHNLSSSKQWIDLYPLLIILGSVAALLGIIWRHVIFPLLP